MSGYPVAERRKVFISINILNFLLYNPVLSCSGDILSIQISNKHIDNQLEKI